MNCNFRHRLQLIEGEIVELLPVFHGYVRLKLLQINHRPTTNMFLKSPIQPYQTQTKQKILKKKQFDNRRKTQSEQSEWNVHLQTHNKRGLYIIYTHIAFV